MFDSQYCGKCGTLTRPTKDNRTGRFCPKCHPDKIETKSRPSNKTGVPCDDRGICKPTECIKALDCDDSRKHKRKG